MKATWNSKRGTWGLISREVTNDIYFGRYSSELAELVPLLECRGRSTRYSDRLHDFSVTIPRYCKDVYVNRFFPWIARFWNSIPATCFPLPNDLNGSKSRINRHLLFLGSF